MTSSELWSVIPDDGPQTITVSVGLCESKSPWMATCKASSKLEEHCTTSGAGLLGLVSVVLLGLGVSFMRNNRMTMIGTMTTTTTKMTNALPVQPVQHRAQPAQRQVQPALLLDHQVHPLKKPRQRKKRKKNPRPPLTKTARNGGKTMTAPGGIVIPERKIGKSTRNEDVIR